MIEFSKKILNGVSFDSYLFGKELRKLILWYGDNKEEKSVFQQWCIRNYGNIYEDVINDVFMKDKLRNNESQICYNFSN